MAGQRGETVTQLVHVDTDGARQRGACAFWRRRPYRGDGASTHAIDAQAAADARKGRAQRAAAEQPQRAQGFGMDVSRSTACSAGQQ